MIVYGIDADDIEALARALEPVLGVPLFRNESPMTGAWYSSIDARPLAAALAAGDLEEARSLADAAPTGDEVRLALDDTDPYYGGPEFPGAGPCLLYLPREPADLPALEAAMRERGIRARRVR